MKYTVEKCWRKNPRTFIWRLFILIFSLWHVEWLAQWNSLLNWHANYLACKLKGVKKKNQLFVVNYASLARLPMCPQIRLLLLFIFLNNWKYCQGRSLILETAPAHSHSAACNWAPRPQVNVRCLCHPFWNAVEAAAGNTWLVSLAEQLWTALFRLLTARPLNHEQQLPYERLWSQISAAV